MNSKVKNFLLFLRNIVSVSFTWLMIIAVLVALISGSDSISVTAVYKLMLLCLLAGSIFTFIFGEGPLKSKSFMNKLTIFLLIFIPLEVLGFYWIGIFSGSGSPLQWFIFVGTIVITYIASLIIDRVVYEAKAREYTRMLQEYQAKRSADSE